MIRFLSLLLLAAMLSACNTTRWVRPDTASEQADRDDIDCQRWAAREASTAAFYGAYGYGPYNRRITRPDTGLPDRYGYRVRDEAGLHNLCMRTKGYQRQ